MRQVLFYVPLSYLGWKDIPVYGYGMMLFLAFVGCSWLANRLAKREKIQPTLITDLALWIFATGILGARVTYVFTRPEQFRSNWLQFFNLSDGGLVFYGSVFGAIFGFTFYYRRYLRPARVSKLKMLDVIAPCVALGLALGRIGCLLTGCCYGNAACPTCPGIEFPVPSAPAMAMIERGHQSAAGFTFQPGSLVVAIVEPHGPAARAGMTPGDRLFAIQGRPIHAPEDFVYTAAQIWQANERLISFSVERDGAKIDLPAVPITSIAVHPTQLYETVSMLLMLFLLVSLYNYKPFDGSIMVVLMVGYAFHRFINEMLRTDTPLVAFGLTLSQNISVGVLAAALALLAVAWKWRNVPSGVTADEPQTPNVPKEEVSPFEVL